jgi:ribosomal protein L12E/L44/L45/RPP1/RPP2
MKYLSAYALAWLSGKSNPSVKDLEAIISSVGGDFDKEQAETVVESLAERDLVQIVRNGLPKLQSGGGGSVAQTSTKSLAPEPVASETKVEEKKDEKKDEDADFEGGLNMFGDDDDY